MQRKQGVVCIIVAGVIAMTMSPLRDVHAGHDHDALCGKDEGSPSPWPCSVADVMTRSENHYFLGASMIAGALGQSLGDPCVLSGPCDSNPNCRTGSAAYMMVTFVGGGYMRVGIIRLDSPSGGEEWKVFTDCKPAGITECRGPSLHHTPQAGEFFQIQYDKDLRPWWAFSAAADGQFNWLRQKTFSYDNKGGQLWIGGQADLWDQDIGVTHLPNVSVLQEHMSTPGLTRDFFDPDSGFGTKGGPYYYSADRARHYIKSKTLVAEASEVTLFSDHHIFHEQDACGNTP